MVHDTVAVRLTLLMERELAAHQQLLEYLREEQNALVDADLNRLRNSVRLQEFQIETIRQLEQEREALMAEISRSIAEDTLSVKLDRIIELTSPAYTGRLATAHQSLREVMDTLIRTNKQNRQLAESGLYFVENNLKIYFDLAKNEPCYQPRKSAGGRKHEVSRLIDKKA